MGLTLPQLPVFVRLTADEIWGVRKACSEAVIPITQAVSQQGKTELSEIFSKLVVDVRQPAMRALTPLPLHQNPP